LLLLKARLLRLRLAQPRLVRKLDGLTVAIGVGVGGVAAVVAAVGFQNPSTRCRGRM
jgi:hypothetical protein